jgi:hypothetical protein
MKSHRRIEIRETTPCIALCIAASYDGYDPALGARCLALLLKGIYRCLQPEHYNPSLALLYRIEIERLWERARLSANLEPLKPPTKSIGLPQPCGPAYFRIQLEKEQIELEDATLEIIGLAFDRTVNREGSRIVLVAALAALEASLEAPLSATEERIRGVAREVIGRELSKIADGGKRLEV